MKIMRLHVAGSNLFKQWSKHDEIIKQFTECMVQETNKSDFEVLLVRWSYNVFRVNNTLLLSGLYFRDEMLLDEIKVPHGVTGVSTSVITGNDRHLLLLDKANQSMWKYEFGKTTDLNWSFITPFWNVETSLENFNENIDQNTLMNVEASSSMNLCLSTNGSIYNIPQKINVSRCLSKVIDIKCGNEHAIAVTDEGNVYTWGNGRRCQLGHGDLSNVEEPRLVEALAGVRISRVAAGGWHSCALSHSGDLYVWGWNAAGQLGIHTNIQEHLQDDSPHLKKPRKFDSEPSTSLPMLVRLYESGTIDPVESDIVDVACGSKHTVVVLEDNSVWAAGSNAYGQLGVDSGSSDTITYFKKVKQMSSECTVVCGPWTTVIKSK